MARRDCLGPVASSSVKGKSAGAGYVAVISPGPCTPSRNGLPISIPVHIAVPTGADAGLGKAGFLVAYEVVEKIFAVGSCGCVDRIGRILDWKTGDEVEGENEAEEEECGCR